MKKSFTIILPLLLIATLLFGQARVIIPIDSAKTKPGDGANARLITLDFATKKFSYDLKTIQAGEFYQLVISNINTAMYKVDIGKTDSTISKALVVPSFSGFAVDDIAKLVAGILPFGNINAPPNSAAQQTIQRESVNFFKTERDFSGKIRDKFKEINIPATDTDIVKTLMDAVLVVLTEQLIKLTEIHDEIDQLVFDYNKYAIGAQSERKLAGEVGNVAGLTIDNLYTTLSTDRRELVMLAEQLQKGYSDYTFHTLNYQNLIIGKEELKKRDDLIKSSYTELKANVAKARDSLSSEATLKYMSSIVQYLNNEDRKYTSMQMLFGKEQSSVSITVQPRDDKALLNSYKTQIQFPLSDPGKFWGVSSGIYIGTLHNEAYSTKTVRSASDTTYALVKEKPGKYEFGVNAMVRHGCRIKKHDNLYVQYGFGPAVSIGDKVRPRVMTALGLGFGKKNLLLLDLGVTIGYVDRLSIAYDTTTTYITKPGDVLVSQLNLGFNFSLSYLFLN